MTKFLLIRHAMTDTAGKSLSGRMAGIHLNSEGLAQVKELATRISGLPIAAVYSSPLERAVETASPIAALFNIQTITREDFNELDFGEWTGCTIDEVRGQPAFQRFNSFRSGERIPGGEAMAEAQLRIITGMEKIRLRHQGQSVVIVSHADLIRAAIAYYAGIHLDLFQRIEISPASISILEMYEDNVRTLLINDTGGIRV